MQRGSQAYDQIGIGYAAVRLPDPRLAAMISQAIGDAETVVNVGAGTGSYEPSDRAVVAVEPSSVMLAQHQGIRRVQATAEHLPFDDETFDVAMAILTVHHWADLDRGLAELRRVSQRQVIFTWDPDHRPQLWIVADYVPAIHAMESARFAFVPHIVAALDAHTVSTFEIPHDFTDGFQAAFWRRPEIYLDPAIRSASSTFASLPVKRSSRGLSGCGGISSPGTGTGPMGISSPRRVSITATGSLWPEGTDNGATPVRLPRPHAHGREIVTSLMVISSDGHATARMEEYRGYLDAKFREEFDAFVVEYQRVGSRNFDPPALRQRLDPELVEAWKENMVDHGRLEGSSDPHARLRELDRECIAAEVLFPDFGLPFELYSPGLAAAKGYPPPDRAHARAAKRAHNRWVADFCSVAPERFAGMAVVDWADVEDTVEEIIWAKNAGLKGVVLPFFDPTLPLYHPRYDPIWSTLEDLDLVVNSHQALSGTSNVPAHTSGVRHPAAAIRLSAGWLLFIVHDLLPQIIWGGVLERFPKLQFVVTESGSSWVVAVLADMDFAYQGSYLRGDIRDALPIRPSEYFARQCYLGSSIFSRAEIEARHAIGLDKMMLGEDYPHHEGTVHSGTADYFRATLGASGVPENEARAMLGETAAEVFGFDTGALAPIAARLGLRADDILRVPEEDLFPLGDVKKPFV